jgi:polyisoprenoid-binding protein YceI
MMKALALLITLLCLVRPVHASEWHVDRKGASVVRFTSEVVALTFDGVTDRIDGYVYWEGAQFFERNTRVRFEVDLNTLTTRNGKRDRDMRDVLETDKWPYAVFEGVPASIVKIDSTITAFRVRTRGKMTIHGVERELEVPGLITVENGRMRITCVFTVKLSEFDIKAPSLVAFVKVSDDIRIALDFHLKNVAE